MLQPEIYTLRIKRAGAIDSTPAFGEEMLIFPSISTKK